MDIRQITPEFYVAPQLSPEEMPQIAAAGIRRILCNRPDAEVPPSHQAAAMRVAAEAAGLEFAAVPLTHQTMTPDVIARNNEIITSCDGAVLAYCASGTRSTIAWALAAAETLPAGEVIEAARRAGYDIAGLRPALESVSRA